MKASVVVGIAVVCLTCFIVGVCAKEGDETEAPEVQVDLGKYSVKDLRRMLADRGLTCEGCVEKSHYMDKLRANLHIPVVPRTIVDGPRDENVPEDKDIIDRLRRMGMEPENVQDTAPDQSRTFEALMKKNGLKIPERMKTRFKPSKDVEP